MIIAVASQKGGTGKTTTSISMAALAHKGKKRVDRLTRRRSFYLVGLIPHRGMPVKTGVAPAQLSHAGRIMVLEHIPIWLFTAKWSFSPALGSYGKLHKKYRTPFQNLEGGRGMANVFKSHGLLRNKMRVASLTSRQ